jgi:hypothetical protein
MDKENAIIYTKTYNTHTLKYYLAIKKNEILSFAAKWMELGEFVLN